MSSGGQFTVSPDSLIRAGRVYGVAPCPRWRRRRNDRDLRGELSARQPHCNIFLHFIRDLCRVRPRFLGVFQEENSAGRVPPDAFILVGAKTKQKRLRVPLRAERCLSRGFCGFLGGAEVDVGGAPFRRERRRLPSSPCELPRPVGRAAGGWESISIKIVNDPCFPCIFGKHIPGPGRPRNPIRWCQRRHARAGKH